MKKSLIAVCAALFISGPVLAYAQGDPGSAGSGSSESNYILNGQETDVLGKDILGLIGDGHAPSLSEDGARIVYYDDNYRIWTVNVDGSRRTQLTSGYLDLNPSWSPDGKKIAFRRSTIIEGSSYSDIWLANADGSNQMPLTDAMGTHGYYDLPAWSPDGTKIAIEAAVGGMMSEIYIIDVHTKALFNVTAGNTRDNNRINHHAPKWLADGERITFYRNDEFVIIETDGTHTKM